MPNAYRPLRAANARRAVCYVRVSSLMGRSGESFHSPETQLAAMRALAGRDGLTEVAVIEDLDRSGRNFNREGITEVMSLARAGKVDVVCLYDLSRLGRNTAESLAHIAELRELGVSVVSTTEKIEDTPEGQFSLTLFLGLAQLRSDQIGREWRNMIAHRAHQGRHHGSPPLGYRRGVDGLEIDPVFGPVVRDAFEAFAGGASRTQVGKALIAAGATASTRVPSSHVTRLLSNPAYAGRVRIRDVETPGAHPPLVDEAIFVKVQSRLAAEKFRPLSREDPLHPFGGGLAVCGECQQPLIGERDKYGKVRLRDRFGRRELGCTGPGQPNVEKVSVAVLDRVTRMIAKLNEDHSARQAAVLRAEDQRGQIASLRSAQQRLEGVLAGMLADLHADKVIGGRPAYERAARKVDLELRSVNAALARADAEPAPPPSGQRRLAERLIESWPDLTNAQRNLALRATVSRVEVFRGGDVVVVDLAGGRW